MAYSMEQNKLTNVIPEEAQKPDSVEITLKQLKFAQYLKKTTKATTTKT